MKKVFITALIILFSTLAYIVVGILIPAGVFKNIEPHFDGSVEKIILPVAGPEDISIDQQSGIAFISADDRRANANSATKIRGAIFMLDLNDSSKHIKDVSPAVPEDFHPHGISLWREPDGRVFLFVINHRKQKPAHVIERYEWINNELIHLESIEDADLMSSPNDLAATGPKTFYVGNDHYYSKAGLGRTLEDYLQRAIAYVLYYDGKTFRKVAEGIAYPNGIALSADQSKLYIASTTGRKLLIYDRDRESGSVRLQKSIALKTGVDNIETDELGNLYIGAHPQLLKFAAHAKSQDKHSPSQVLKLIPQASGEYEAAEIFLNDGSEYSGSSVAAIYMDIMLIGSVFENSILYCKLSNQ
ncbi:MAG TPA: SMP-30/gluconolactonase/LRE family protein [Cyclobacteriaceae bacterium]|nr:SMP-30/gluconolactonase/LRE family protein [Cyclobacteriaceae bacterium]